MNKFTNWLNHPTKWYHFWRPQSGPIGGTILVWVVILLVWLTIAFVRYL